MKAARCVPPNHHKSFLPSLIAGFEAACAGDIARIRSVFDRGAGDTTSSAAIAWSNSTEGTHMPTPIVYRDRLHPERQWRCDDACDLRWVGDCAHTRHV